MNQATTPQLPDIAAMRQLVQRGESRPLRWRQEQLQRLQTLLTRHEQQLIEALGHDLGKPQLEASMELVLVHQELRLTRSQLRRWMAPEALPLAAANPPYDRSESVDTRFAGRRHRTNRPAALE
ncbi:MAG: aldehyde dehydrogenase family protein, partial [Synechococcaceae bacterium WBB_10_009]|nr:aldehyde dehydrogenase family protein [Synechococcaceae bacterium WBB_10_009]